MYDVVAEVSFESAHRLLSYVGKCQLAHGHSMCAEVCLSRWVVCGVGFVIDFGELKKVVKGWVDEHWDHGLLLHEDDPLRKLCEGHAKIYVMPNSLEPTAENIAKVLFDVVQEKFPDTRVEYVSVRETPTNIATYRRD